MTMNGLLRGILLFLCAQIPLLIFFIYLLYIGVGISDFANLSDDRHLDRSSVVGWARDLDDKVKTQIFEETVRINQKLNKLQASVSGIETANATDRAIETQGTSKKIASLQNQFEDIDNRLNLLQSSLLEQLTNVEQTQTRAPELSVNLPENLDSRLQALEQIANSQGVARSEIIGQLNDLNARLSQMLSALPAMQKKLGQLGVDIANLEDQRLKTDRTLLDHEQVLSGHQEVLSGYEQVLSGHEQAIAGRGDQIAKLGEKSEFHKKVLAQQIEGIENKVSAMLNELETLANAPQPPAPPSAEELLQKHAEMFAPPPERKPVAELQFAANDWQLNPEANRALNSVITRLRKNAQRVQVGIYGFTVKHGPLNFSMALADKRARVVAETIREAGVVDQPITIFVVPEYQAYRDQDLVSSSASLAARSHDAVHIYLDEK